MEKLNLLKLIHSGLEVLSDQLLYYVEDSKVYIIDYDDNIVIEGSSYDIEVKGHWIIRNDILQVIHASTLKSIKVTHRITEAQALYNDYIVIQYRNSSLYSNYTVLFNSKAEALVKIPSIRFIKENKFNTNPVNLSILYSVFTGSYFNVSPERTYRMVINNNTEQIEYLDRVTINEQTGLDAIAVELDNTRGFEDKLNLSDTFSGLFKYKLIKNNRIISDKTYLNIRKTHNLTMSNYMMTYTINKEANVVKGIIDDYGNEILDNFYDDISYIGENTFLLNYNNLGIQQYAVYNTKIGTVLNFDDINKAYVHETMPIIVVQLKDNQVKLVNSSGKIFNVADIIHEYNCKYSIENPGIIRIENIAYVPKYITNKLVPITNNDTLRKLRDSEWLEFN